MEQNNLKKGADFLSEIGIVLRRDGYDTSAPDNGIQIDFNISEAQYLSGMKMG